jgi:uncharacterized protein
VQERTSEVEEKVAFFTKLPIIGDVFSRIEKELPGGYYYHSLDHAQDVMKEVITYASYDGLQEREIELLAIAAAYHDSGFLTGAQDHEARGALLAKDMMRQSGNYTETEVDLVAELIRETKLPESESRYWTYPRSSLACYLIDADVGNLGRPDFFEKIEALSKELTIEIDTFRHHALAFAEIHRWFSHAAKQLRQDTKAQNLRKLRTDLGQGPKLDAEKEKLVAELSGFLSRTEEFSRQVGPALEMIQAALSSCKSSLRLTNSFGATLVLTNEPTNSHHVPHKVSLVAKVPFFCQDINAVLEVATASDGEEVEERDLLFINECADLLSLSLSSSYLDRDKRLRATTPAHGTLSLLSTHQVVGVPEWLSAQWEKLCQKMYLSSTKVVNQHSMIDEYLAQLRCALETIQAANGESLSNFKVQGNSKTKTVWSALKSKQAVEAFVRVIGNDKVDEVCVSVNGSQIVTTALFSPHVGNQAEQMSFLFEKLEWETFEWSIVFKLFVSRDEALSFKMIIQA